ncbi:hypothetical protein QOZ80_6BG0471370 [Eleusine coracana subsp. coracana]|nr:hypothetical protein QOZ80_6BG0471370 [Eleusine coracana subsp. coracana]
MSPIRGTSTKPAPGHASGSSSGGKPCFPCVACGRTFPTQQAMAGHSSTHSRARSSGDPLPDGPVIVNPPASQSRHGPGVAVAGGHHGLRGGVHVPAAVVPPRPSHFLPFVHRHSRMMSNQQQLPRAPPRVRLLSGASTRPSMADVTTVLHAATSFRAAAHHVLGTPIRWAPVFPYYTLLPLPRYTASSVPVLSRASSVDQQVPVDLTLQLGSGAGGGGSGAQRRMFPALDGDGGGGKMAVAMDGGDRSDQDLDGFDLELHLGR